MRLVFIFFFFENRGESGGGGLFPYFHTRCQPKDMRSFMRSYVSATLVKTPATRWVFSDSVTVSKPKWVSRSVEEEKAEALLIFWFCWFSCGVGAGDDVELVVEKDDRGEEWEGDEEEEDRDGIVVVLPHKRCLVVVVFVGREARRHRTACRGAAIFSFLFSLALLSENCRRKG